MKRWLGWSLAVWSLALGGCHLFPLVPAPEQVERQAKTTQHSFRVSQFVFLPDFEIQKDLPIFRELGQLREQVHRDLRLPSSNADIMVHLFEDRDRYQRFMDAKYPDLPKRRAFFVAQPKTYGGPEDLLVFTYWGDRIHQDLRHELTHALLHSVIRDVPLWLDEGLAEYYEVPAGWNGVNPEHVDHLLKDGVAFDLKRLEGLKEVQQMTPAEYRESWAWVHLMLRGSTAGKQALVQYLREAREGKTPASLRQRLADAVPVPEHALRAHLSKLRGELIARGSLK